MHFDDIVQNSSLLIALHVAILGCLIEWTIYTYFIICTWVCFCFFLAMSLFLVVSYAVLSVFFRVASLALGQSYDCPSASEVTLKKMGRIGQYLTTANITKHKWCAYFSWFTLHWSPPRFMEPSMGPTWVLSAPDGPHVGPMNLAIRDGITHHYHHWMHYLWHSHKGTF